jgi:hypothetical protein
MEAPSRKTRITLTLSDRDLDAIDEWRSRSNWPSRQAGLHQLLKLGLENPSDADAAPERLLR